jgi:aconitate hydratase
MIQTDNKNADDHRYLQTAAAHFGFHFSLRARHLPSVVFGKIQRAGKTLVGSDSHTPSAAALSVLAIGAGGMDVALAAAGTRIICLPQGAGRQADRPPFELGQRPGCDPGDAAALRRQGCLGKVVEYYGRDWTPDGHRPPDHRQPGHGNGSHRSMFPSDGQTRPIWPPRERNRPGAGCRPTREHVWDEFDEINMSKLVPMIARPSSPGDVVEVRTWPADRSTSPLSGAAPTHPTGI